MLGKWGCSLYWATSPRHRQPTCTLDFLSSKPTFEFNLIVKGLYSAPPPTPHQFSSSPILLNWLARGKCYRPGDKGRLRRVQLLVLLLGVTAHSISIAATINDNGLMTLTIKKKIYVYRHQCSTLYIYWHKCSISKSGRISIIGYDHVWSSCCS